MRSTTDIMKLIPEDDRAKVQETLDALLDSAKESGRNEVAYDRRQAEKAVKENERLRAELTDLTAKSGKVTEYEAKLKEHEKTVAQLTKERDGLLPYRKDAEERTFVDLFKKTVTLRDDALLDYVKRQTGVALQSEEKDGKVTYKLANEDKLIAWRDDPANKDRVVKTQTVGNPPTTNPTGNPPTVIPGYRATAPTLPGQNNVVFTDPVQQAQFAKLPPTSQERVLREMQRAGQ